MFRHDFDKAAAKAVTRMSILLKKNFPASIVHVEDEIHKRLKNREQAD